MLHSCKPQEARVGLGVQEVVKGTPAKGPMEHELPGPSIKPTHMGRKPLFRVLYLNLYY